MSRAFYAVLAAHRAALRADLDFGHVIDVTAGTPPDARWCDACQKHRRLDTEKLCPVCLDDIRRGR